MRSSGSVNFASSTEKLEHGVTEIPDEGGKGGCFVSTTAAVLLVILLVCLMAATGVIVGLVVRPENTETVDPTLEPTKSTEVPVIPTKNPYEGTSLILILFNLLDKFDFYQNLC